MCRKITTLDFIKSAQEIHGILYDYSQTVYKYSYEKVIIICKEHGGFKQEPNSHTAKGHGCPKCGRLNMISAKQCSYKTFIKKAQKTHGTLYEYFYIKAEWDSYPASGRHVTIKCKKHGFFRQHPTQHYEKTGCPKCATKGFNLNKSAILYWLRIDSYIHGIKYKIGITNHTVKNRYSIEDFNKITVLKTINYLNGQEAYDNEQRLLKLFYTDRYIGKDRILQSVGTKEIFNIDILGNGTGLKLYPNKNSQY